jgi:hypothetical protein
MNDWEALHLVPCTMKVFAGGKCTNEINECLDPRYLIGESIKRVEDIATWYATRDYTRGEKWLFARQHYFISRLAFCLLFQAILSLDCSP